MLFPLLGGEAYFAILFAIGISQLLREFVIEVKHIDSMHRPDVEYSTLNAVKADQWQVSFRGLAENHNAVIPSYLCIQKHFWTITFISGTARKSIDRLWVLPVVTILQSLTRGYRERLVWQ